MPKLLSIETTRLDAEQRFTAFGDAIVQEKPALVTQTVIEQREAYVSTIEVDLPRTRVVARNENDIELFNQFWRESTCNLNYNYMQGDMACGIVRLIFDKFTKLVPAEKPQVLEETAIVFLSFAFLNSKQVWSGAAISTLVHNPEQWVITLSQGLPLADSNISIYAHGLNDRLPHLGFKPTDMAALYEAIDSDVITAIFKYLLDEHHHVDITKMQYLDQNIPTAKPWNPKEVLAGFNKSRELAISQQRDRFYAQLPSYPTKRESAEIKARLAEYDKDILHYSTSSLNADSDADTPATPADYSPASVPV